MIRFLCAIPLAAVWAQGVYTTSVAPKAGEDLAAPCQYELTIAMNEAPVRAVFVIFDRGREVLDLYNDPDLFHFAERERLAILFARHCSSKEREDMDVDPNQGIGRALFTALQQLSASSKHGEVATAKVIAFGFSGAGSLAARLPGYATDRMLATIAYAPGQYQPLGMDTIELPPAATAVPQLIIANSADPVNGTKRPFDYFQKYFNQGAPWVFAIQNGVPHQGGLANIKPLIFAWLDEILNATPENTGVTVLAPNQRSGWWLYLRMERTDVRDELKQVVEQAAGARAEKVGSRVPDGYVGAGWVAGKKAATAWLDFVKKSRHPVNSKYE